MDDLEKPLTAWRGAGMMVNIVLGAGLLTLPGLAYQAAGPGALAVWVICAALAIPLLSVFAILGRRWPASGGLATILAKGFGEAGYNAGTLLFLGAVLLGLPAIAMTGGYYMSAAVGGAPAVHAAALLVGATAVNLTSSTVAARVNVYLAGAIVFALFALLAAGLAATRPDTATIIADGLSLPPLSSLGAVMMMVFFAFTGWEVAASLGGEFRSPRRDIPLAIAISFAVVVALYLGLAIVVTAAGITNGFEAPFATIVRSAYGNASALAVSFLSVALIFANLLAAVWAVSRMVYAAAKGRMLPAALGEVTRGMPRAALLTTGACLLFVVGMNSMGLVDLSTLLTLAGQNFLILYAGAAAVLFRLGDRPWERLLGAGSILLVAGLIVLHGSSGAFYPAALIIVGAALACLRNRSGTNAWPEEMPEQTPAP